MKLLFTWLLGVPVLVLAMVLARAMSPQGFSAEKELSAAKAQFAAAGCLRQGELHTVRPLVTDQQYRIACNGRPIH